MASHNPSFNVTLLPWFRYIHPEPLTGGTYRAFSVDPALDPSLHTLVSRTLPLASHYSIVGHFIEEGSKFIHGMVNQVSSCVYL